MDNDFGVRWTSCAINDLRNIIRYIAEQRFAPMAAAKLEKDIFEAANRLSYSPYQLVVDKERGIRKCIVRKNYMILFKIHEDKNIVQIRRIFDCRRNWQSLPW